MNRFQYFTRSLLFFRRQHSATLLGIALSTAILTGALIVGDSVRFSLQQITLERLGKTQTVITAGERIFTRQLAARIDSVTGVPTSALLRANGMAIIDGGQVRVNQLQVWGIDSNFADFTNSPQRFSISGNEVLINEQLAHLGGIQEGSEFLIRVNKISAFPSNTPFVSVEENTVSLRVKVKAVLSATETGNLNLQNIQSAPRNVLLDIAWLNQQMGLTEKANVILLAGNLPDGENEIIHSCLSLADLNLKIRSNTALNYSEIVSERVFLSAATEQSCMSGIANASPVFSYFVNDFQCRSNSTPYSFISSVSDGIADNEIIVNEWLAENLNAKVGDTIRIKYFKTGALRILTERDTSLVVRQIVPIEGVWADVNLMPDIPGLSDAGHCRDWEAGVPVDLDQIRPKDEAYWNQYKGTPKAFVLLETAQRLWGNRFGQTTAIRFPIQDKLMLETAILDKLSPEKAGFQVQEVKQDGLTAASQGVDFGQLFIGLSFFVLLAAVLLTILLFRLSLNFRKTEIATLASLGFSRLQLQRIFLTESAVLVLVGIVLGIPFSIVYNKLILVAVNSIWVDIVRTSIVYVHIRWQSIFIGALSVFLLSVSAVFFILKSFLRKEILQLQQEENISKTKNLNKQKIVGLSLVAGSFALILWNAGGSSAASPEMFYVAGFGLLPGIILLLNDRFGRLLETENTDVFSVRQLLTKKFGSNRKHHILIVSFLSIGIFLVVSTGMNRKDLARGADLPSSGTGGYSLFVETSIPVPEDLNNAEVADRLGFSLPDSISFVQFQLKQGDDASCLNLNRISRPRLIGFEPEVFQHRKAFSFVAQTDDFPADSLWMALNAVTTEGFVPAIADQTVIKWGLGKNVGDTLVYSNEKGERLVLKLIGGLANSIFQGNVLIGASHFASNFPSVSGSSLFLVESNLQQEQLQDELQTNLRSFGPEITPTVDRLLSFYRIENTYLNIFLMLGALGLLVGTLGLAILIYRLLMEKMREMAVLLALGFRKKQIFSLFFAEYSIVVGISICAGIIPAIVSGLSSIAQAQYINLFWWALGISLLVFFTALIWIAIIIRKILSKQPVGLLRND